MAEVFHAPRLISRPSTASIGVSRAGSTAKHPVKQNNAASLLVAASRPSRWHRGVCQRLNGYNSSEYTVFSVSSDDSDVSNDESSDSEGSGISYPSQMASRLADLSNGAAVSTSAPADTASSARATEAKTASSATSSAGKSRAGLFRSPISGGVQSATSAHGLPQPAVAVRNLVEQARFAHLCTIMSRMHNRRKGYPFGSLVDFATDPDGHPVFLLSPLAIHTRNLLTDPRCTMVVQTPGWSGLANARATLFGDVYPLPFEMQEWAQQLYSKRHHHAASQQWGNFHFYRMETICDIYFVGGFGTVSWIDVKEYTSAKPDIIAADNTEITLQDLNRRLGPDLKSLLESLSAGVDDASFISIDGKGVDIRVRQGSQFIVQRLSFESDSLVDSLEGAEAALRQVLRKGVVPVANGFQS